MILTVLSNLTEEGKNWNSPCNWEQFFLPYTKPSSLKLAVPKTCKRYFTQVLKKHSPKKLQRRKNTSRSNPQKSCPIPVIFTLI